MPVSARRLIRKMRGGAQAHLIEADDGRFYVVKFRSNPQHRRILVNELVSSVFLRYLRIATPETAFVQITPEFLSQNPETYIQLGTRRAAVEPGWHFGSCYPGDPDRVAVYDFLPDAILTGVVNHSHFRAILPFDKWVANADARQAIFLRARIREWAPNLENSPGQKGFLALMVDNGFAFEGPHWSFTDAPLQGLYVRHLVYERVRGWDDFEPWLQQVIHFPESVMDEALKQIPPEWLNGDQPLLAALMERLLARRRRVPDLIRDCCRLPRSPFPNWQERHGFLTGRGATAG